MAKETILTYLDQRLTKQITEYDVAIDWDAKNHTIELVLRLFAENPAHQTIDDAQGVASDEDIIEFEDGILLVDANKSTYEEEDFLAVIPYEGKKGIKKALLDGLVDYIKEILIEGESDLLDFLNDDAEDAVFELTFDEQEWLETVAKYQTKDGDTMIPYPSY
ncbi:hypothetical protein A5886_002844 [Enterococcus sp. 8G7_MSG3316]|uniref:Uncharacterized protein n=1 Tax=Candidatus Enterococcus testudinis TaxID=1834191 RepID=A0A242AAV8_9ENTE|nr:DUF3013 family protein [Enterococcus sp. 8G7_MSG3316]OTN77743.1 hypothetical protein A5886_002844 [Enterococcus sp. 8G7_MSG3316]